MPSGGTVADSKKPGERIKTDRRDARNLALALRANTLSLVHIPTPDQGTVPGCRTRLAAGQARCDWSPATTEFAHPKHFMAWLGWVPGEYSSGNTRKLGPITRCGNRWARTWLTEAAWSYRYSPKVSRIIETRAQEIDPAILAIAWKAQIRLHHQYTKLTAKGKHKNVAITAVARELAAFIWDAARQIEQPA
jgi:transposase